VAPKSYKAKFIEPGIISYNDSGAGTVLVSREALDRMAPTFKGCPVIFIPEHHDESDKDTAFNFDDVGANPPSGIVSGAPYWGDDGWQWVDMLIWDDSAVENIDKGFSVSCAYTPNETAEGGKWHELLYDEEVLNGEYMHMAIVPRPRYEGSQILANSKGGPSVALFGFGKKNAEAVAPAKPEPAIPEKKEEPKMLNDDATIDVGGTPVALHELIAKYMETKGGGSPQALTPEDEISLPDGSTVKVADLIAAYGAGEAEEPMENAEPAQDEQGEPAVKQVRANAAPAKPEPKKVNQALKNAATRGEDGPANGGIETEKTRLRRGETRYSLAVSQGGK